MSRKRSVAAVAAAVSVSSLPAPANDASAPPTVVARKRARRSAVAAVPAVPVVVSRPVIDLRDPNAKDQITAAFPHVAQDARHIDSTAELERAALGYLEARDAAKRAEGVKEACGNVLRLAIGDQAGIMGEGWIAGWPVQAQGIDWQAYVKGEKVDLGVVEKYRKDPHRVLTVKETADGEGAKK